MTHVLLTSAPEFSPPAWDEFRAVARQARRVAQLAPGVWLTATSDDFSAVGQRWQAAPPIFVRHCCPVDELTPLTGDHDDIESLRSSLRQTCVALIATSPTFSVQTRILATTAYKPFEINERLATTIQAECGARLDVRAPQQIVSVVIGHVAGELVGLMGVSLAGLNLSDWAGGARRFKREPDQVSRAEFKLLEAWERFGLSASADWRALDLGAAPGGWTRILRQHQVRVTAVDPAELAPSVAADHGVAHIRLAAESFLRGLGSAETYAIILNDMRLDPLHSSRLMLQAAPHLRADGWALMTLKLSAVHNASRDVAAALDLLGRAYTIIGVRQLFHNRQEVTVALRRDTDARLAP